MERARISWTDERLDDLSHRVDDGFNRIDGELRALRSDMNARFDAQDARIDGRIDSLQRTIIQVGGGMIAAVLAGVVSLIATQL